MMTLKEFAEKLENQPYRGFPDENLAQLAKENDIVILYGASDDLIEADGAIRDELSKWAPNKWSKTFYITKNKSLSFSKTANCLQYRFKVFWGSDDWTWRFTTGVQHEVFHLYDDDYAFCEGIIFYLKDLYV